jgi:hypothetical protein
MLIIPANSASAAGGFDVANSLRFNDGSTDNLSRTKGTSDSTTKGTYSFWFKPSKTTGLTLIENGTAAADRAIVYIQSDSTLKIFSKIGNSTKLDLGTNRVFRDTSAFYNVVIAIDTTQGTASNRVKLYVNGTQETSFASSTYPDQNDALRFFTSSEIEEIGIDFENDGLFDGYMCEVVKVDGSQLAPDQFGEFDEDSGIWKPIDVSGLTFGTNGFYLDFEDSSALGNDAAGSNNFTVNNLTAIDQSTDTCTNNFATVSPLVVIGNTGQTYADGNLTFNASSTNWTATNSTIGASSGKWYAEFKVVTLASSTGYGHVGITGTEGITAGNFVSTDANSVGVTLDYRGSGQTYLYSAGSSVQVAGVAFSAGAIMGIAVDMDNKKFYLSQNGTYLTVGGSVGNPGSGSTGTGSLAIPSGIETFLFAVGGYSTSFKGTWNFGSPAYAISSSNADGNDYGNFEYAVPSGYFSLNTKNLAEYG